MTDVKPVIKQSEEAQRLLQFAVENRLPFAMMLNTEILNVIPWGGPMFPSRERNMVVIALDAGTYEALDGRGEPPSAGPEQLHVVLSFGDRLLRCSIPFIAIYQIVFVFETSEQVLTQPTQGAQGGLRLVVDNTLPGGIDA